MPAKQRSTKSQPVRPVGALNELLALTFRTEPERAQHIRHTVRFLADEAETNSGAARAFADLDIIARKLIGLHAGEWRSVGFAHCDLAATDADPLFLRPQVLAAVRELVGHSEGLLLVSGLRQAVTRGGRQFSARRRTTYQQTQGLIEALVAKFAPQRARLHVIFI